mmetsp:Transcript_23263/g.43194  ORF Transcript_23263/g.43194 Transcript_23263/m.43194 type:complete len:89 (-) Transcript_23263:369-635(-)
MLRASKSRFSARLVLSAKRMEIGEVKELMDVRNGALLTNSCMEGHLETATLQASAHATDAATVGSIETNVVELIQDFMCLAYLRNDLT